MAFLISVLAAAVAVIDLVTGIIHIVVLHRSARHIHGGRFGIHSGVTRLFHVTDAAGEHAHEGGAEHESDA
jgi:hypothetical protein